jgi:hypothetical protein
MADFHVPLPRVLLIKPTFPCGADVRKPSRDGALVAKKRRLRMKLRKNPKKV